MSKIVFDYGGLQKNIVPSLEGACEKLESARRLIENTSVPSSCAYYSYLRNLGMKLLSSKQNLNRVTNWVSSTNTRFENALDSLDTSISNLEIIKISKQ